LTLVAVGFGTPGVFAAAVHSEPAGREIAWIKSAAAGLDPQVLETLSKIRGPERQLLALRAYLRADNALGERWSWSQSKLDAYPSTPEGRAAAADIDAVESAFAKANPGYTARANRMPRSLEQQLDHWNENGAVGAVAAQLTASLVRQFPSPSEPSAVQLREALSAWKPRAAAPLAAPGLSAHGQGRAFDFQIERDGRSVAGFDAAAARQQWDGAGWTQKLHAAVVASGRPFTGPLQSPYEPWHYAYTPDFHP
jgi:hypothetical protein